MRNALQPNDSPPLSAAKDSPLWSSSLVHSCSGKTGKNEQILQIDSMFYAVQILRKVIKITRCDASSKDTKTLTIRDEVLHLHRCKCADNSCS
jgi:hypothetical protein